MGGVEQNKMQGSKKPEQHDTAVERQDVLNMQSDGRELRRQSKSDGCEYEMMWIDCM
jgi:hypothetical protein